MRSPRLAAALGSLLIAALQISRADGQLAPALPPPAAGFHSLARSPASSQLVEEFFRHERANQLHKQPALAGALRPAATAPTAQQLATAPAAIASAAPEFSATLNHSFRLDQYHTLEEIYGFVDALAARYKRVQVFTIGRTNEQRPIKALELVNNATDPDFIWLDALTHAREWVTGSTLLYALDRLVAGPESGADRSAAYAKNYIIVPVVNPDGYVYTWTTNRMWRKNRSRSGARSAEGKQCIGADLNRNFDHSFGGEGASSDACSHIYSGARPFSEPETRALAEMLWSLRDRVRFYLTMHSFNQLWACPYAHTTERSAHYGTHMRVLRAIQRAVVDSGGVHYEAGPLSTSLYVGSGFGIDFAYDKCGIVHSYLVELRDKGAHGFLLPPDQIMPTARETWAGLRAGLRAALV